MTPSPARRLVLSLILAGALGASASAVALPATVALAGAGVVISAAPSSGSGPTSSATLTTSGGLGCAPGDDVYPYLSKTVPTVPLTEQVATDLMFDTNVSGQFADGVYIGSSNGLSSDTGEVTAADGVQVGQNMMTDSFTQSATLLDAATKWGASASGSVYGLTIICSDSGYSAPIENDGVVAAAVTTITLTSAGAWQIGDQTPDTTTTTVTASQSAAGGSIALNATVADTTSTGTVPTGTVQFFDGDPLTGAALASPVALVAGVATLSPGVGDVTGTLAAGSHTVSAVYTAATGVNLASSHGSATVTVRWPVQAAAVTLAATPGGGQVTLTATVTKPDGSTATDATGTVAFSETSGTSWTMTGVAVQNGIASATDSGLTAGTAYTFTAAYTAGAVDGYASSDPSAPQSATPTEAAANTALTDGGTVTPGTAYDISFDEGTFASSDPVDVVLHSDPTDLGTVTSAADGGLAFTLTAAATSALAPGSSHQLTFTSVADPTTVRTIAFTVPAASSVSTTALGSNPVSTFLTDSTRWAVGTPAGLATLVALAIALLAGGVATWNVLLRRQRLVRR